MRKLCCLFLCLCFFACTLFEQTASNIESIPDDKMTSYSNENSDLQAESPISSAVQTPTRWEEDTIRINGHTTVISADVVKKAGEVFTYLVKEDSFSEDQIAKIKNQLSEGFTGISSKYDFQEIQTKKTLEIARAPKEHVFQFESWIIDDGGYVDLNTDEYEAPHQLENVDLSEEEAVQMANKFLQSIDFDISAYEIAHTEKGRIIEARTHETIAEGWNVSYMPSIPGCKAVYFSALFRSYPSPDYVFHKDRVNPPPRVELLMTSSGCIRFYCEYPAELIRYQSVEDQLLDFDSVTEAFKQYFVTAMLCTTNTDLREDPIIQQLIFTYSVREAAESDAQEASGMIRPIWAALYTSEMALSLPSNPISYVCIDAITGEIVEPVR